jgi:exosortase
MLWLSLAYLFLLAPSGTPLLPLLRDATTHLTTILLGVSGIDYFAEGYDILVRTGNYAIAPGCAGLNFFLATLTIGPLYCVLMYRSLFKQAIAMGIALAVVVLANGIRVFGIIAIAEVTNRQVDISADHLFYGWAFFSVVLVVLMAVGMRFADPIPESLPAHLTMQESPQDQRGARIVPKMALAAVLAVAASLSGLVLSMWSVV